MRRVGAFRRLCGAARAWPRRIRGGGRGQRRAGAGFLAAAAAERRSSSRAAAGRGQHNGRGGRAAPHQRVSTLATLSTHPTPSALRPRHLGGHVRPVPWGRARRRRRRAGDKHWRRAAGLLRARRDARNARHADGDDGARRRGGAERQRGHACRRWRRRASFGCQRWRRKRGCGRNGCAAQCTGRRRHARGAVAAASAGTLRGGRRACSLCHVCRRRGASSGGMCRAGGGKARRGQPVALVIHQGRAATPPVPCLVPRTNFAWVCPRLRAAARPPADPPGGRRRAALCGFAARRGERAGRCRALRPAAVWRSHARNQHGVLAGGRGGRAARARACAGASAAVADSAGALRRGAVLRRRAPDRAAVAALACCAGLWPCGLLCLPVVRMRRRSGRRRRSAGVGCAACRIRHQYVFEGAGASGRNLPQAPPPRQPLRRRRGCCILVAAGKVAVSAEVLSRKP
mmetsp:Transcript_41961/g.125633  ORF Transcript_41961/g.125633 Transcript_41961/m.125633 type:complete len:459 (-) Transcript_41961:96-1472(-)